MAQIHLHAESGDYAPIVLMPGDPKRAKRIAARFDGGLEGSRLVNEHRGLLGYTGTVFVITELMDREFPAYLTWPQAEALFSQVLSIKSDHVPALHYLALVCHRRSNLELAIAHLHRAAVRKWPRASTRACIVPDQRNARGAHVPPRCHAAQTPRALTRRRKIS